MTRQRKIVLAKAALLAGALPILLFAHEYGPDPGYCGVPNENGGANGATCATAGCHTGTANSPSNKGSIAVSFPNGMSYTPGVTQQLAVTISDPATTQKAAGFQLTARLASNPATMAGTFATVDTFTQVICSQTNLQIFSFLNTNGTQCGSKAPLQYIEHTGTQEVYSPGSGGYENSIAHGLPYTYNFTWTPPSTNVGNIVIYVAGNAGVGNPPTQDGDHIYSTKYTLTPLVETQPSGPPSINNVYSAGAFGLFTAATAGSWIEIYGTNLGPTPAYTWAGSDFSGNNAPAALQQVTVTVNGIKAFLDYVSPTQVNAQVPGGVGTGNASVVLTTTQGSSAPYTLPLNSLEPGLLTTDAFNIGGKQYVAALHSNGTFVVPTTAPSLGTPAKPGETIIVYGIGFGPSAPSGGSAIPPGVIVTAANTLTNSFQFMIGGTAASTPYAGLAPNYVGLYQFNITVPTSALNSDAVPFTFNVAGNTGSQTLFTAVHN